VQFAELRATVEIMDRDNSGFDVSVPTAAPPERLAEFMGIRQQAGRWVARERKHHRK
jgi:hypothetical protein